MSNRKHFSIHKKKNAKKHVKKGVERKLHDVANAHYGKNSQKAREWVEATLTRLFMNNADQIIAGIKRMKP